MDGGQRCKSWRVFCFPDHDVLPDVDHGRWQCPVQTAFANRPERHSLKGIFYMRLAAAMENFDPILARGSLRCSIIYVHVSLIKFH